MGQKWHTAGGPFSAPVGGPCPLVFPRVHSKLYLSRSGIGPGEKARFSFFRSMTTITDGSGSTHSLSHTQSHGVTPGPLGGGILV
jgi:hypothetical protein